MTGGIEMQGFKPGFFFQAEDGIQDAQESRGLGDVYKRQPVINIGLRPNRSDSGPQTNCDAPNASSSADSVYCACAMVAFRLVASAGRAGKYKSVVTG